MMDFHQASQAFVIIISLYVAHVASVYIQLTGGSKPNQGRLEVLQDGRRGVLCGNTWTDQNTEVVCRQLGFPGAVKFSTGTTPFVGDRDVITPGEFSCYGNETILSNCRTSATCTRVLDVDITCQDLGYNGCYLRSGIDTAYIYSFNDSRMTNDLCIEGCKARGVNYYAILLETTCFCHISLEGLTRKDYDFPCSSLCPGNPEQSCGKRSDYFTVFRTDVGFCAEPEPQFLVDATKNSTRYGSIVEFKCATNSFELVGNKAIQCLGNSAAALEWDGEYPECIEKTFVSLGIAFCAMGAIIVFLSMFFAVCCEIRRKLRKKPEGGDPEPLSSSITQDAIPNTQSNIQTHILQQERSDIGVSVLSASSPLTRPLPREATPQATGRPHAHVGIPTVASPRTSGEYTGVYEELDDYIAPGEDIGGGMDLIFERHPSEDQESSYEMSNLAAAGDIGQAEVGHLEIPSDPVEEEKDGYLEVRSDHGENKTGEHLEVLSAQPEGSDGYLEVLPDEGSGLPSTADRPNTYIEVIDDEGAPGAKDRDSKEYTYIPDISEVANRPRHPDPQDHKVENQHEYDDTLVPPIYKNEKTMVPRPHRQDVGQ